jgi:hypothetical protein
MVAKKKVFVDETTNETMDIQQAELSEPEVTVTSDIQEDVSEPEVTEDVTQEPVVTVIEKKVEAPMPRRYTPPVVEKDNTPTIQYGRNGRTTISHEEANRMG